MDFDELHTAARRDVDADEETRTDIRRWRELFCLPVEDAIVEALLSAYLAGRHHGGEWRTTQETAHAAQRSAQLAPQRRAARAYTGPGGPGEHDLAGRWVSWDGGQRYNVAFAARVDEHRAALQSPLVRVYKARFTLAELEAISDRIATDASELEAAGIDLAGWGVDHEHNVVDVEARAADAARARQMLTARYGPAVQLKYLGADAEIIRPQPWGEWSTDASGRVVTIRYAGNAACRPLEPIVVETAEEVRITARDVYPNGYVTMAGTVRSVTAKLAEPLGLRRLVDGTNGQIHAG